MPTFGKFVVLSLGTLVFATACTRSSPPKDDGGVNVDPCPPGTLGCVPANVTGTSSPADSTTVAYSLRGVDVIQSNDTWKQIGFDLDGIVTSNSSRLGSCLSPSHQPPPIDGTNGIDNVFGSTLGPQLTGVLHPTFESDLCCFAQHGRGVLILRVSDWNGAANDDQVTASLLSAVDGTAEPVANVTWDASEHGLVRTSDNSRAGIVSSAPRSSSYYVSRGDFQIGHEGDYASVKQRDASAYIREGYLVMTVNSAYPVTLSFADLAGIRIPLIGGRLVARISADKDYIDVGALGGRMSEAGIVEMTLGSLANEINDAASVADRMSDCEVVSDAASGLVHDYADVTSSLDDGDASNECDAVSVGIGFTGVRVRTLELAPETLCVPKADCTNFAPGVSCPEIWETHDGTTAPICWIGESPTGAPTGSCDTATWNVP